MMTFDPLDTRIVDLLARDGRTSNREVGRVLGISEGAVRKRLKRLESLGAARVAAVVTPRALGLSITAFVRIATAPAATRAVAQAAMEVEHITFVGLATGRFNVLTAVTAADRRHLGEIVDAHMRRWAGVVSIEVVEILSVAKHRLDLVLIPGPHPPAESNAD